MLIYQLLSYTVYDNAIIIIRVYKMQVKFINQSKMF